MSEINSVVIEERPRFRLVEAANVSSDLDGFAQAVADGLSAESKSIPSYYFYDEIGSALFEQICDLPEYYLTRSEREILMTHASEILEDTPVDLTLVELGSGSAVKTRLLIEELLRTHDRLLFTPIDISRAAIEDSADRLLPDLEKLEIVAVRADYHTGLSILKEPLRHCLHLALENLPLSEQSLEFRQIPDNRRSGALTIRDLAKYEHVVFDPKIA